MHARILLVEDDADLHISLALRLKSAGHEVLSAMNGSEVVPIALRHKPDLILLDIGLPGQDGHSVASALAADDQTRVIPIIYLTARHELNHRVQAAVSGAAGYLVKPCMPQRLFGAINAVLGRSGQMVEH
jgi:DNA-binding response OmpR family regulator